MLGLAIRMAQRMGLHNEAANTRCAALEAEMRRRLWWSLVLFDSRINEITASRVTMLVPTWDCRPPLNVNDFDLQPGMKDPPTVQGNSTESLFPVVRSEIGEFIRHSSFHLEFTNPALMPIVQHKMGTMATLEKMIEDKYLKSCNLMNPVHFIAIWWTRGQLAKSRLIEYYSHASRSSAQLSDEQRDRSISDALTMLECDTRLMSSPLAKRYSWFLHSYFPFPAYIHLCQELRRQPVGALVERSWKMMDDNYEVRSPCLGHANNPFFKLFSKVALQAWEACESVFGELLGRSLTPPSMVSIIKQNVGQTEPHNASTAKQPDSSSVLDMGIDVLSMSVLDVMGGQGYRGLGLGELSEPTGWDIDGNPVDRRAMDWDLMHAPGW